MDNYYVMGTGSRSLVTNPKRLEVFKGLETHVLGIREEHPGLILISGMGEGWDEAVAVVAINNKIPWIAYVPHPTYGEYYWGKTSQTGENRYERFQRLCSKADDIIIVSKTLYVPDGVTKKGRHANYVRNDWMVAASDRAVVYDTGSSGTRDAVKTLRHNLIPMDVYPFQTRVG
jgi:hypothetical protein